MVGFEELSPVYGRMNATLNEIERLFHTELSEQTKTKPKERKKIDVQTFWCNRWADVIQVKSVSFSNIFNAGSFFTTTAMLDNINSSYLLEKDRSSLGTGFLHHEMRFRNRRWHHLSYFCRDHQPIGIQVETNADICQPLKCPFFTFAE